MRRATKLHRFDLNAVVALERLFDGGIQGGRGLFDLIEGNFRQPGMNARHPAVPACESPGGGGQARAIRRLHTALWSMILPRVSGNCLAK